MSRTISQVDKDYKAALLKAEDCIKICKSHIQKVVELTKEISDLKNLTLPGIDMLNTIQKQSTTIAMMSTINKTLQDTALAVIRKIDESSDDQGTSSDDQGTSSDDDLEDTASAVIRKI
jgi:hypothetical protein